MKRFFTIAMMLLASSFALSQNKNVTTQQPSGDEQAVMQLQRDILNAYVRGDVKTLEHLLADGLVDTSASGSVSSKQDILKDAAQPPSGTTVDFTQTKAHMFGDAAVVTGIMAVKIKRGDKEDTNYYRVTDTFARRKSGWQLAASQQNRVPVWRARKMEDSELKMQTAVGCDQEGSLKSLNSDTAAYIRFTNSTNQPVTVHWINYDGKRDPSADQIRTLKPRETRSHSTFLTHPFLVTDASGKCLGIYQPIQEPGLVVIK